MPSFKIPGKEDRLKQRIRTLFLQDIECYCTATLLCANHEALIDKIVWVLRSDTEKVEDRIPQSTGLLIGSRYSFACWGYNCGDCTREMATCACECHRNPRQMKIYHSAWPYRTEKYGVDWDAIDKRPQTGRPIHGDVHRRERKR